LKGPFDRVLKQKIRIYAKKSIRAEAGGMDNRGNIGRMCRLQQLTLTKWFIWADV